jgi:TPR repeat protein
MKLIKIFLLLFITTNAIAQTTDTTTKPPIDSATMYLTGTFKQYNPQRTFQINLQNATNGNAKAMNALAIQYMKGLGVDSNFNLAVYWFNQAATNNYTKALVNLGMLYKHKATDSLGYSIAYDYFNQALQANDPSALFAQGYMLYKGLGCTQSYTAAIAFFNQGIAINQANCMYFKGLCYKFGYGVSIDADSANYYINKAALRGYKQANAELANNNTAARTTKQITPNSKLQTDEFINIPKSKSAVQINGEYKGEILQYDYSGKKLLTQIPITLQVSTTNNIIKGNLQLLNSQAIELNAIQQGNQLIFSQTTIQQSILNTKRQTVLVFKTAQLNLETKNDSNYLTGSLQLFNTHTHETDKPINIKLSQLQNKITDNTKPHTPNNVSVYPNPTNGNFTISFHLTKPSAAKINIYNPQGKLVDTKIFETLPQGKQNILIAAIKDVGGIYTATIVTNHFKQTTSFIKE